MMRVICLMVLMVLSISVHAQNNSQFTTTTTTTTVNTVISGGKTITTTKVTTTEVTKNAHGDIIKSVTKVDESSVETYEDSTEDNKTDKVESPEEEIAEVDATDMAEVSKEESTEAEQAEEWSEDDDNEELDDAWGDVSVLVNTAKNFPGLTLEEKKVYVYVNLARLDGKKFTEEYVIPYYKGRKYTQSYYKSLIKDLKKVKNLPMLKPHKKLIEAARYHAEDMGSKDMIGHVSSDGTKMADRLSRYFPNYKLVAENCSYGFDDAIDIVMQLLLDDGVESLGHRENILDKGLDYMGVSITEHGYYRYNCVQDFGKEF